MELKSNRSRVVVDPEVQWGIARRICFHWVLFFLVLLSVDASLKILFDLTDHSFAEAVRRALLDQVPMMGIMAIVLPMFLFDTLKLSNRFAGPMYRVRKSLEMMADGVAMPPIKFRSGDFWGGLADDLNGVRERIDKLEEKNQELQRDLRRLQVIRSQPVVPRPSATVADQEGGAATSDG